MSDYQLIRQTGRDKTTAVKSLLESLTEIDGSPANMRTVYEFERILRTLNQYVTLLMISDSEDIIGIVNIDASVNLMKNYVERLR